MKIVIADLSDQKVGDHVYRFTKEGFLRTLTDEKYDWKTGKTTQTLFQISNNIEGDIFHKNYLEYLEAGWANHLGVTITPDIVWHTLLCEVASIVKENPKKYAALFTTTPDERPVITVQSLSDTVMPMEQLYAALQKLIPTDTELFLPTFSTTTMRSTLARYVTFADVVSPYYEYAMTMCGIPYVDVLGTADDWARLANYWSGIADLIGDHEEYFVKSQTQLNKIHENLDNAAFWRDMFRLEHCCGSGHGGDLGGWIKQLFRKSDTTVVLGEYPSHVSGISYKNIDTGKKFKMFAGVFGSFLNKDLLVPDFSMAVFEDKS